MASLSARFAARSLLGIIACGLASALVAGIVAQTWSRGREHVDSPAVFGSLASDVEMMLATFTSSASAHTAVSAARVDSILTCLTTSTAECIHIDSASDLSTPSSLAKLAYPGLWVSRAKNTVSVQIGTIQSKNSFTLKHLDASGRIFLTNAEELISAGLTTFYASRSPSNRTFEASSDEKIRFSSLWHDLGEVKPSGTSRFSFSVANIGDKSVVIRKIAPSCGCVTLNSNIVAGTTIQPREEIWITGHLEIGSDPAVRQQIHLVIEGQSATPFANVDLLLLGYGVSPGHWSPRALDFGTFDDTSDGEIVRSVTLFESHGDRFDLKEVAVNNTFPIRTNIRAITDGSGKRNYSINCTLNPSDIIDEGEYAGEIMIETTSALQPQIRIPFFVAKRKSTTFLPSHLSFGLMSIGDTLTRSIQIRASQAIRSVSVLESPPECSIEVERSSLNEFKAGCVFAAKRIGQISDTVKLLVELERGEKQIMLVPITAFVDAPASSRF